MIFFCKKRRSHDFLNYIKSFVPKEVIDDHILMDSTREISFYLFLTPFFKLIYGKKMAIILTSVCASKKSSISLRKPASYIDILVSKLIFPINVEKSHKGVFTFYLWPIILLLKLFRNIDFNPWYEGASNQVDIVYSRYPLSIDHENELKKRGISLIYKGEFFEKLNNYKIKNKDVLFSLPQFYEQGLLDLEESKKIISKMISYIYREEGIYPDIILHPRMERENYLELGKELHQFNLNEILPYYKKYYCINSSTIFIALKFSCSCRVFLLSFLDYSAFDNLVNFDLKFITLND